MHARRAEGRRGEDLHLLLRAQRLVRCPTHPGTLEILDAALGCTACDLQLVLRQRTQVLVPARVDDGPRQRDSHALRLMRSPLVARIYENRWRPALVKLVGGFGYATEDAVVDRHVRAAPGLKVLDLCSGTARAGRRWLARGAQVLAVDRSPEMLAESRRRCPDESLVLVQGDARHQFPQTQTFDAVLCFAALHLLPDPCALLSVAAAALRPGGVFVAWALVSRGMLGPERIPPGLVRRVGLRPFAPGALLAAATAAGLKTVESFVDGAVEFVVARQATAPA